jgi:nucleoside-diphosphate kinase
MRERTLVLIKPDGVKRGLIGKIISTFERANLQITRLNMCRPRPDVVEKHYPNSADWLRSAGQKALRGYQSAGLNILDDLGTDDPLVVGGLIKKRLVEYLCSGDVVTMVVEGNLAISNVRRLCGSTLPSEADPASIRGRYCTDSPDLSFAEKRPVLNLIHASGSKEEAEFEIDLWFGTHN